MRQTTKDCAEILEVSGEENDSTNHQIDLKKNERSMIVSKQGATCSGCSQKTKSQKKTINVAVQTNNSDEHKGMAKTLKQLEIENRRLIRESERQKEEYEQMLDVIEKKVLRALLQQKALKTECFRLRKELSLKKNCRCAFLLPSSVGRSDFSSPLTSPAHSLLSVNSLITSGLLESPMINGGEQLCSRPQSFNFDVVDIRRLTAHRHSQLSQEGVTEMTLEAPILPFGSGSFGRFRLPDLQETLGPNEEFTVGACSRVGHLNVSKSSNSNLIAPTLPLDDGYSTMSNEVKGWESQNENVAAILSQRREFHSYKCVLFLRH